MALQYQNYTIDTQKQLIQSINIKKLQNGKNDVVEILLIVTK